MEMNKTNCLVLVAAILMPAFAQAYDDLDGDITRDVVRDRNTCEEVSFMREKSCEVQKMVILYPKARNDRGRMKPIQATRSSASRYCDQKGYDEAIIRDTYGTSGRVSNWERGKWDSGKHNSVTVMKKLVCKNVRCTDFERVRGSRQVRRVDCR